MPVTQKIGEVRRSLCKFYLCAVFKLLILIGIIYLGYRLFFGPPLLQGQDPRRVNKRSDDDDYADYEEVK